MGKWKTHNAGLVLVLALATGCTDGSKTLAPESSGAKALLRSNEPSRRPMTLDDEFVNLAVVAPGFGGLFYDSTGRWVVNLTDLSQRELAKTHVNAFLVKHRSPAGELLFQKAAYDFLRLAKWHQLLQTSGLPSGVTVTDIDEQRNRIVIGFLDQRARDEISNFLVTLPIPPGAVILEQRPPALIEASLRDVVRPIPGGVQITVGGGICTLGYVMMVHVFDPGRYFVTNSHCTGSFGVVTGEVAGQPDLQNPVATEAIDPPLFSTSQDANCPAGRACRYSDAALFSFDPGIQYSYGAVAKVSGLTVVGTLLIDYSASVLAGTLVKKVGRTSGQTQGTVSATCVTVPQFEALPGGGSQDTGRTMLCQNEAGYSSQGGDSGSPVFIETSPGRVTAVGVHWGSGGRFSSLSYIFQETGVGGVHN